MRKLNTKQKALLDEWWEHHKNEWKGDIQYTDAFSYELLQKLEEINDHETIVQNINRYLNDKMSEEITEQWGA